MKRIIDFTISLIGLILLIPVFLVLYVLIRMNMGAPVLFRQQRPGLNSEPFMMTKFRSMRDAVDKDGKTLPDQERLTSLGKFIRKTSLDELPGLWNVFLGDMSLVGPRPLLMDYLPLYSTEQMRRHNVRPGITGWAQVNGRNAISWEEKFKFDVWYIDNQSLLLDIKILLMTAKKVFVRDGISAEGEATMPRFNGNVNS